MHTIKYNSVLDYISQKREENHVLSQPNRGQWYLCCGSCGCATGIFFSIIVASSSAHPSTWVVPISWYCCGGLNIIMSLRHKYEGTSEEHAPVLEPVTEQPQSSRVQTHIRESLHGEDYNGYMETDPKTGQMNYVITEGNMNLKMDGIGGKTTIMLNVNANGGIKLLNYEKNAVTEENRDELMLLMKSSKEFRNVYLDSTPLCEALQRGYWKRESFIPSQNIVSDE